MGIRNAVTVLLLVSVATLSLGTVRVLAGEGDGVDCEWKYRCDLVLQREPFICGRWASEAEKICPQQQPTTSAPEPAAPAEEDEDVGSFRPFHMIKAPCLAPHVSDRHGRCRLPFA